MTSEGITIQRSLKPDEAAKSILDGLRSFNNSVIGAISHFQLVVEAKNASDEVVGGAIGGVDLAWLKIDVLWVKETHRHEGLGSAILTKMEEQGIGLGATRAMLDTFSFQAPEFYKRLGYIEYGRIKDFCQGHDRYFLEKRLG